MTAKNRSAAAQKALKATVKELRSRLDRADARAKRWKSEAARLRKAGTELEAQVKELKKRNKHLTKAPRTAEPPAPTEPSQTATAATVEPDASWTVAQLRAEARSRGLTGVSGKTKAQLLEALR